MSSHRLQGSQQGYKKILVAHAQGRGHIFQIKWSYIFHHFGPSCRIPSHSPGQVIYTPRLHLTHPLGNMNMSKYHLDLHKHQHTSRS